MTSFSRKLYDKDPAAARAAEDFARQNRFQRAELDALCYGKTTDLPQFSADRALYTRAFQSPLEKRAFSRPSLPQVSFGRREAPPVPHKACATPCGHPACSNGCTLAGRA